MSAIVPKNTVKPEDVFWCIDCGQKITGQDIIDGEYVYYARIDKQNPANNVHRCIDCHEDRCSMN